MRIIEKIEKKMYCPKCGVELEINNVKINNVNKKRKKRKLFTTEEIETIKNWTKSIPSLAEYLKKPYGSVWSRWKQEQKKEKIPSSKFFNIK